MFYQQKVDMRSRTAMVDYLTKHFRYSTMSSWNRSTSYANNIKIHRLGLTSAQVDLAYDVLDTDYWDEIRYPIDDFTDMQGGEYTIGTNGRSSGYFCLYKSQRKQSEYKSVCTHCGQRNFKRVHDSPTGTSKWVIDNEVFRNGCWQDEVYLEQPAVKALTLNVEDKLLHIRNAKHACKDATFGNRCGRCGLDARVNHTFIDLVTWPGQSIDQGEDFSETSDWPMDALRNRAELVQDFDKTCDEIRDNFISLLDTCKVVEKTILVPKKVMQLQCSNS